MTSTAVEAPRTTLRAKIERYMQELLDQARRDGLRGALTAAAVRRIVVRDLTEVLLEDLGD